MYALVHVHVLSKCPLVWYTMILTLFSDGADTCISGRCHRVSME